MTELSDYDILAMILAIFLPPLGVFLKRGCFHADFWINLGLTLLGWIPGVIHAWYVTIHYSDRRNE
jgi:uncharacterized membrane protein YqaE (UPF0057 family)